MFDFIRRAVLRRSTAAVTACAIAGLLAVGLTQEAEAGKPKASKVWRKTSAKLRSWARADAKATFLLASVRANALTDLGERAVALALAKEEFGDSKELSGLQFKARQALAIALDEDVLYTKDVNPADFVDGVDNPLFPLAPGNTWTYEGQTDEGLERIVVTVLDERKLILGVSCVVVRDTVTIDGVLLEDTLDWYAQDADGNVWYMGEIALNYDEAGDIIDVAGSWLGGRDGAHVGVIMLAAPAVGDIYRQEFLLGEAEDYAEVLATNETVTVPAGTFNGCLKTFDGSPADPESFADKFYAPGVGPVLELESDGVRVELISFSLNN